ncbi:MAG: chain length-determining protein [Burkholderiales bacterium]|nr:chain length-determining protein [Burkholderiales bacterium]
MDEVIAQIGAILRRMWKVRWPALAVAWVVSVLATALAFLVPDQYEATARIYVDTQSILKPLMQGLTVQPNVEQQVGMLSRTLISRPNIEKLVRMADLDLKSSTKAEQDELVDKLMKKIEIRSTAKDNLYSLAYREPEQDKAKRVIQSMVSIFVESSLGASRKDTDSAKVLLNEQIKGYEQKLEEAEARLKEFRLRNMDLQPADGKDSASRLSEVSAQLEAAKLELREAENARDAAKKQIASADKSTQSLPSLLPDGAAGSAVSTPEIDSRIDVQRKNLDMLLQRYTEQHPDIVSTRRLLKDLEEQKKKEVAELRKAQAAAPTGIAANPQNSSLAYQELSRVLATSEVQVASLQARVSEYAGRVAALRNMMKTAPQIEAEAAQLNRDYAINKKNYEDLVARRQSAVMSGDLDVASGVADFRLIDPPRVSPHPVSPNRMLLLAAALLVGLGSGVFAAFAASQLRPAYDSPADLRLKTGLPLLGVVSMIVSDDMARQERKDRYRFFAGSGGLVMAFAGGFIVLAVLAARQVG